eukprot:TRINITY_DN68998_c0_g1_i1.p1 TRINITY_DN68998_c0_g1~~TRINITY_DN68998_c0_g1_i1.p1  ORF type:complete len:241 (-),score=45.32 TRINITY_DN68998_c0_g1_i1:102-785(-)
MYAGYHAEKPYYFSKKKRMFLPMFNNKYDDDEWAAVCDLENLREREKGYCAALGSKMVSSSTGPTHSIPSTLSSQTMRTTHSTSPTTSVKPFRPLVTTTSTRTNPSTGSTPSTHSTHTTSSSQITSTTKLTGPYTSQDGKYQVYYREELATSEERKVFLTCKRSNDGKVKSNCFVNKETDKNWGQGVTNQKANHYIALAKGFAKSNCTTRAVFGPGGNFWDKKDDWC